jgi:hypothetical protein
VRAHALIRCPTAVAVVAEDAKAFWEVVADAPRVQALSFAYASYPNSVWCLASLHDVVERQEPEIGFSTTRADTPVGVDALLPSTRVLLSHGLDTNIEFEPLGEPGDYDLRAHATLIVEVGGIIHMP